MAVVNFGRKPSQIYYETSRSSRLFVSIQTKTGLNHPVVPVPAFQVSFQTGGRSMEVERGTYAPRFKRIKKRTAGEASASPAAGSMNIGKYLLNTRVSEQGNETKRLTIKSQVQNEELFQKNRSVKMGMANRPPPGVAILMGTWIVREEGQRPDCV